MGLCFSPAVGRGSGKEEGEVKAWGVGGKYTKAQEALVCRLLSSPGGSLETWAIFGARKVWAYRKWVEVSERHWTDEAGEP